MIVISTGLARIVRHGYRVDRQVADLEGLVRRDEFTARLLSRCGLARMVRAMGQVHRHVVRSRQAVCTTNVVGMLVRNKNRIQAARLNVDGGQFMRV